MNVSLPQHLTRAVRRLMRAPAFTVAGVLTLMVGIGATTAVFSLVNGGRKRETDLFEGLRSAVGREITRLQRVARALGQAPQRRGSVVVYGPLDLRVLRKTND